MGHYVKSFESFNQSGNTIIDFSIPTEEYIIKVLKAMDIEYVEIKIIGEGGYGFIIDLGNNSILKITSDPVEAFYANKLQSIFSTNIVRIYNIKEIVSKYQEQQLFAIHSEKLITNISPVIKKMVDYLHKPNKIKNQLIAGTLNANDIISFFKSKIPSLPEENILLVFDKIDRVYKECIKYELPIYELHSGNIGIAKNNTEELVYFDISSPIESHKPELEIIAI